VSAELKMLRFLQERVNKSTKKLDALTPEQAEATDGQEHLKLSEKQGRVKDLMRRLAVKLGKENDVEEGR
jgi:hypothetical protein